MPGPLIYARVGDRLLFRHANATNGEVISISPHDSGVSLVDVTEFPDHGEIYKIAAIVGVIALKTNRYAVVAKKIETVGILNGHTINKVVEHAVVPVGQSDYHSSEQIYLNLLKKHLKEAQLYYSLSYDLTNSAQRNEEIDSVSWKTADQRFFWNYYATEPLRRLAAEHPAVNDFIVPMIYGYANIVTTSFKGVPISLGLLTRRSRFRAGTRYFRRGIDEDGHVANFNETEQIFIVHKAENDVSHFFSYLQTRGSVPVYWAEVNNLRYRPNLMVGEGSSLPAFQKHMDEQTSLYGHVFLVNLVNQKGYELPIKETYEANVNAANNPAVSYTYFDFHRECSQMKWHRIWALIENLENMGLDKNNVFHKILKSDGKTQSVLTKQTAVVRSNCMDCLDRTNVVQSVLGNWVLQQQFSTTGLVVADIRWESDLNLRSYFQNLWADNADAISKAYSGTGALKTDFTRTGRRTYIGATTDFFKSVIRYYRNNFTDGPRQDNFDLFLGNFKPYGTSVYSPFPDRRPFVIQLAPLLWYAALTLLLFTIISPREYFTSSQNLGFFFGSAIVLYFLTRFILNNGMQFVNWPKLTDLGFLVAMQAHNKEYVFNSITYAPSTKFVKPTSLKRD